MLILKREMLILKSICLSETLILRHRNILKALAQKKTDDDAGLTTSESPPPAAHLFHGDKSVLTYSRFKGVRSVAP